jgi:site-specific recombinase XerD
MPITLIKRHEKGCQFTDRRQHKCGCKYWVDARPVGKLKSLDTRDRSTALRFIHEMEIKGIGLTPGTSPLAEPMTIERAIEDYLASLKFRDLAEGTFRMHQTLLAQLRAFGFFSRPTLSSLADFDHATVKRFIHSWTQGGLQPHPDEQTRQATKPMAALARGKKLERLRQFFKYAVASKWIAENPTAGEKGARVKVKQKEAFTPEEMTLLLEEADKQINEKTEPRALAAAIRLRALILFMRFSGLRISDAVGCQIGWVKDGRVRLTTRKQHKPIDVALPAHVIDALDQVTPVSNLYWFWTGQGKLRTAKNTAWRQLNALFKAASIPNAHPHRFRDTFAVSMLEAGKTLQEVADALGDTLTVVQRHYNPGSDKRQQRLDEAVRSTWVDDPILKALEAKKKAKGHAVVIMPRRAGAGS